MDIQQETYTWRAVYDEHSYHQENAENSFADVDHARVKTLLLIPLQGGASHRVDIPSGATPVFFRRRSIEVNPLQGETQSRPTVHCIGWKHDEQAVYLFAFDSGNTLLTSDLQAV